MALDLKMEVYTSALELIGFLEVHRSVIWEEKAFSSGSFSVDAIITPESISLLKEGNIVWIKGETAGIIEYVHEESDESGPYIEVKGYTLTGILNRRILWGMYNLKGTAPDIMHRLVDDCCINPTRGDIDARKIPGLVSRETPAGGDVIQFQATGGALLERLETLGETYGVAFGVAFNAAVPQMEFWTRWGRDLTINQSANPPVLYSTELDDVLKSEYTYNSQDHRNVALVGGEGEGNDRVYVTVSGEDETPAPPAPPQPPVVTEYTVTLSVDPDGGGIASGGRTVAAGTSITVTASPNSGYEFVEWRENGVRVSTSASYTFIVNADRALAAVFAAIIPTYTISVAIEPSGYGTVTGAGRYKEGDTVTLKATADDGYRFTAWRENGATVHSGDEYTFTASRDVELVAAFDVVKPSRLPDGYQELEYVDFDGATRISGALNYMFAYCGYELDAEFLPETTAGIFAGNIARSQAGTYYYFNYISIGYAEDGIYTQSNGFNQQSPYPSTVARSTAIPAQNGKMKISYNLASRKFSVNDASVTYAAVSPTGNVPYQTVAIGGCLISNLGSSSYMAFRFYEMKASNSISGAWGADLIPCRQISDGVVGLYDILQDKFYSPSTGTLIPGPDV